LPLTIKLKNDTSCLVVDFKTYKRVPAVAVYSFYYAFGDKYLYYGGIPAYGSGDAALSPQPNVSGEIGLDLGYSPDPSYKTGTLGAVGAQSGWYIYQVYDSLTPNCTQYSYCLLVGPTDPCANLATK
jgi:hypothetical protein